MVHHGPHEVVEAHPRSAHERMSFRHDESDVKALQLIPTPESRMPIRDPPEVAPSSRLEGDAGSLRERGKTLMCYRTSQLPRQ